MKAREGRDWMIRYVQNCLLAEGPLRTEDGILKRVDFDHLQKIMEVYAKCVLYETRVMH